MVDISKCNGLGCRNKEMCYRYTALCDERQSWFAGGVLLKDGFCEYLIKNCDDAEELFERSRRANMLEAESMFGCESLV